jgi:hypothetical protein
MEINTALQPELLWLCGKTPDGEGPTRYLRIRHMDLDRHRHRVHLPESKTLLLVGNFKTIFWIAGCCHQGNPDKLI